MSDFISGMDEKELSERVRRLSQRSEASGRRLPVEAVTLGMNIVFDLFEANGDEITAQLRAVENWYDAEKQRLDEAMNKLRQERAARRSAIMRAAVGR